MTTTEINTLTQLWEFERIKLLTILSSAQNNPFMAGYLLSGNKIIFNRMEGASLCLYECQQNFSPLYTHKEKYFDKIPIYYQVTIYYVDPLSRQTYLFASQIACDGNPANTIAVDPDGIETYLTATPVKQNPPTHFNAWKFRSTIQPNTFSAHTAGLYSPKPIIDF